MRTWLSAILLAVLACDGGTSPSPPAYVAVSPQQKLLLERGSTIRFEARVTDARGAAIAGAEVAWSVADPSVATIDANGQAIAVATGGTEVRATAGDVSGTARLEVYIPQPVAEYVPGRTYFGRNRYVEYIAGDLPLVVSAGHGGGEEPDEIPRRSYGTLARDSWTQETTRAVRDSIIAHFGGGQPHIVISRLRRTRLDPNREIVEAAQGSEFAEQAWREYHRFIVIARDRIAEDHGRGFYVDLHGHSHPTPRVELGYLLTGSDLSRSDAQLNAPRFPEQSSIRSLARRVDLSFADIVRGPESLGALLFGERVTTVPSPLIPDPHGEPFFSGGYSTRRHGSLDGGVIDGVQIELHGPGIRDTEENRRRFAGALARSLRFFLETHYRFGWDQAGIPP
ncbi:MAG: Ig-like domain-containing protein [Gammaproteobacteria bacterium]|nr:Ig-like domain-containing protein [Gammaproteobacteria bacterium]